MFGSSEQAQSCKPSQLYLKRRLNASTIRQKQLNQKFTQMRQQRLVWNHCDPLFENLPTSLQKLIFFSQEHHNNQKAVMSRLALIASQNPQLIFNIEDNQRTYTQKVYIVNFFIKYQLLEEERILELMAVLLEIAKLRGNYVNIFKLMDKFIRKYPSIPEGLVDEVLHLSATDIFSTAELDFYLILSRKDNPYIYNSVFTASKTKKLMCHFGDVFYNEYQRTKIAQVLIQITSKRQNGRDGVFYPELFRDLIYYMQYSNEYKVLVDRCSLLLFNILVDCGSSQFIALNYHKDIYHIAKKQEILSLKTLVISVYFCIFSCLEDQEQAFCLSQFDNLLEIIEMILYFFSKDDRIVEESVFLLDSMFQLEQANSGQQPLNFKSKFIDCGLYTKMRPLPICQRMLQAHFQPSDVL